MKGPLARQGWGPRTVRASRPRVSRKATSASNEPTCRCCLVEKSDVAGSEPRTQGAWATGCTRLIRVTCPSGARPPGHPPRPRLPHTPRPRGKQPRVRPESLAAGALCPQDGAPEAEAPPPRLGLRGGGGGEETGWAGQVGGALRGRGHVPPPDTPFALRDPTVGGGGQKGLWGAPGGTTGARSPSERCGGPGSEAGGPAKLPAPRFGREPPGRLSPRRKQIPSRCPAPQRPRVCPRRPALPALRLECPLASARASPRGAGGRGAGPERGARAARLPGAPGFPRPRPGRSPASWRPRLGHPSPGARVPRVKACGLRRPPRPPSLACAPAAPSPGLPPAPRSAPPGAAPPPAKVACGEAAPLGSQLRADLRRLSREVRECHLLVLKKTSYKGALFGANLHVVGKRRARYLAQTLMRSIVFIRHLLRAGRAQERSALHDPSRTGRCGWVTND
ncbi:translation initiation factor IF-2-like [Acinonyx jubatus]|uniref:Translation initiation factor IF-2-like n=1 Tax=Acinonyx jubatus TaxID=32536 RepID=A0ABM3NUJ0_ACIJB|nr:translation initiation factor IF-2-like [Acinonyx jubatus]